MQKLSFYKYCDRPISFLVNNSGNSEPIWIKFYTLMGAQMGLFPGNFGRPHQGWRKCPRKKRTFLSGRQGLLNAISQWIICVKFGDSTWIDMVILSAKNCKIFSKGSLTPKLTFWGVFQWVFCYQITDKFRVKTTIPSYSPRANDVPLSGHFLCTSYRFGDTSYQKHLQFIQFGFVYSFAVTYRYLLFVNLLPRAAKYMDVDPRTDLRNACGCYFRCRLRHTLRSS